MIRKIIEDESWLEGERRGRHVAPDDPVVRDNVCQVILRIGGALRESIRKQLTARPGPTLLPMRSPQNDEAA
ncbi:MAG TPA: hypothetical protein VL200_11520 [Lacunisphaera sp.]|nr:hypothetical protein [Lacunisphaera sp.]